MKKILTLFIIALLSVSILTSCKKDKGNPPTLPSESSMAIDFSNFASGTKSAGIDLQKGVNEVNWDYAALVAGYWKSIIIGTLAVPVAAYTLAVDKTPTFVTTNTWQWSYSVSVLSVTYTARLTGQIRASDVLWNMYVTKTGGTEFLWFTGTSKLDGTGGEWDFNYSAAFVEPVLKVEWTKTGTDINYVKYTYVRTLNDARTTDTFKDSYIEYGKLTGTYNAYYTIHFYYLTEFYDARVEWSTTGVIGRVRCQKYFPDNNFYCWDINRADITCL